MICMIRVRVCVKLLLLLSIVTTWATGSGPGIWYLLLRTIWPWPESGAHVHIISRLFYSEIRERRRHEYRADTGASASDEDGLAEQSGCVKDGHRWAGVGGDRV